MEKLTKLEINKLATKMHLENEKKVREQIDSMTEDQLRDYAYDLTIKSIRAQEQAELNKILKFGRNGEQILQIGLFDEADPEIQKLLDSMGENPSVEVEVQTTESRKAATKKDVRDGRRLHSSSFENLPVKEVNITQPAPACPECGEQMVQCGIEDVWTVEYEPGRFYRLNKKYPVFECPNSCTDGEGETVEIHTADNAPRLFEKSPVSPSVLNYIIHCKFVLGLPLYRIEQDLARQGFPLTRVTMSNWLQMGMEQYVQVMYDWLLADFRHLDVVGIDETYLKVIKEMKKTGRSTCYMIAGTSGPFEKKNISVFMYSETRSKAFVVNMLGTDYMGLVMADGYTSYDASIRDMNLPDEDEEFEDPDLPENELVRRSSCLVHARRYFIYALRTREDFKTWQKLMKNRKLDPDKGDVQETKAAREYRNSKMIEATAKMVEVVLHIGTLYHIESQARKKGVSVEELTQIRQTKSKPIWEKLCELVESLDGTYLINTNGDKAVKYFLRRKDQLGIFLENGAYPLDNQKTERAIKPFAIGRKNFLFCQSVAGANAAAAYYSLLETCKLNRVDPSKYFSYALSELMTYGMKPEVLSRIMPYSGKLPSYLYI